MSQKCLAWILKEEANINSLELLNIDIPEPKHDQVLVQNECSTINYGDIESFMGVFECPPAPRIAGLKGSGTVIKSGGGVVADTLVNKRVAFSTYGSWSEFSVVDSNFAYPLLPSTTFEQGTSICYNPLTVLNIIDFVQINKHRSLIQNSSSSSLGKQLILYCNSLQIPLISIVRKPEQVSKLKSFGAEHILDSSSPDWLKEAKKLANQLQVSVGFDAVGGSATNDMLEIIQDKGTVYSYGCASGESLNVESRHFVFHLKSIRGLNVVEWLNLKSPEEKEGLLRFVQENFEIFGMEFCREVEIEQVKDEVVEYSRRPTDNKVLIRLRKDFR